MPPNRPYNVIPQKPPVQEQLNEIWKYLSENQQKMNRNMQLFTPQTQARIIAERIDKADNFNSQDTKVPYSQRVYAAMKANIMKTADIVVRDSKTFSKTLAQTEAFVSEFGKLFNTATLKIDGNAVGIRQLYTWQETLKGNFSNYVTNSQQYIKDGLLDFDGASPIYGIEVGLLSETIETEDNNGKKTIVSVKDPIKTRITPAEWSLWRNDTKLCYTNENKIYFPNAQITGGSIKLGNNFSVDRLGNLIATSGSIGGWVIKSSYLSVTDNKVTFGLYSPSSNSNWWLLAADSDGKAITGIKKDGSFFGSNVDISGSIYASGGTIGGWTINKNEITSKSGNIYFSLRSPLAGGSWWMISADTDGNTTFGVKRDGTFFGNGVDITGKIKATSGSIGGWDITSDVISSSYNGYRTYLASASSIANGTGNWMRAYNTSTGTTYFSVDKRGKLFAQDATIKGTLQAGSIISTGCKIGNYVTIEIDEKASGTLTKIYRKGSVEDCGLVLADTYTDIRCGLIAASAGVNYGALEGTWINNDGVGVISDRNRKNNIEDLTDKYEAFFDKLRPVRYKYNNGTSNRYHTGFIAQEIEEALESVNMDTTDFAGFVACKKNTEDELLTLRYNDFIPLNTLKIKKLEERIKKLELQFQQLQ